MEPRYVKYDGLGHPYHVHYDKRVYLIPQPERRTKQGTYYFCPYDSSTRFIEDNPNGS